MPVRVSFEGDITKAEALRGFAMSQLRILQNAMTFQDLKQDVRRVSFANGSTVEVRSNWGLNEVRIFAPPIPARVEEEVEELVFAEPRPAKLVIEMSEYVMAPWHQSWVWAYGGVPPYSFLLEGITYGEFVLGGGTERGTLIFAEEIEPYEDVPFQGRFDEGIDTITVMDSEGIKAFQDVEYWGEPELYWAPRRHHDTWTWIPD